MASSSAPSAVFRIWMSPAAPPLVFAASASLPARRATAAPDNTRPDCPRNRRRAAMGVGMARKDISFSRLGMRRGIPVAGDDGQHAGDDAVAARPVERERVLEREIHIARQAL